MSTSRFEELVAIITEDYNKTEEYLERNSKFIEQLTLKLGDYIGCGLNNLFCYTPEADVNKVRVQDNIQSLIADGFIKVVKECSFSFPLLIQIKANSFNNQYCSLSFKENNLIPPSKVVLYLTIKQQGENLFIVRVPTINEKEPGGEKMFPVNPTDDDSWIKLLEFCFEVIKQTIEGGLEKRIMESIVKIDNTSKKVFRLP